MKENKRITWLLSFIFILAFVVRFLGIESNPPSLTWDEVAWGYNAYSLGIDGKDEFGRFLPFDYLESFGDFKPPVYAYLTVIPVKLFGLNEFATRFPSAFLGVVTVIVTYFLVKRLFYNAEKRELYALISSGILAVSPWHVMLSRAAFEANVATFFIAAGVWLFLGGIQEKKWYLPLSAFSFALSIYTFNSARVVAPLLVILLGLVFFKKLFTRKKQTIVALLLGIGIVFPLVGFLLSPQASLRFREVNIFTDGNVVKRANAEIANDNNAFWSKIIHNRRVGYAQAFLKHYFDNLSFQFLFIKGDGNLKFSIQDVGQMYLWEFPFFLAGIIFLVKRREGYWWLIPAWLLLAIIPSATARETPHALRIEASLPTFQILTAYGLSMFFLFLSSLPKRWQLQRMVVVVTLSIVIVTNIAYFFHSYAIHYPREVSGEWQYGYKEAISYIKEVENEYDEVRMTTELGRPHEYVLFYLKYPPERFRQTAQITRDPFGFVHVHSFDKYVFGGDEINVPATDNKKVLYIEIPRKVPNNVNILKEFKLLNGQTALQAYAFYL